MKSLNLLKLLILLTFFVILNTRVFGQDASFIPDAKKDSAWIAQSIATANKLYPAHRDTNYIGHDAWTDGKVLYSPDGSLKATQLTAGPGTFTTTLQFSYQGKVFQQDLSYNTDFSGYSLCNIHKLPGERPAYLFLLASIEDTAGYEHDWLADFKTSQFPKDTDFNHIKTVAYVASAFRFEKDSLFETTFPLTTSQKAETADTADTANTADTVNTASLENSKSYGFTSVIKHSAKAPRPFLKYDAVKHVLSFLDNSNKYDDNANAEPYFLSVESGAFEYKDTSFVLVNDTSYVYPRLDSDETIAHHNYRAGKYNIRAAATRSYHDYGHDIYPVLSIKYTIGADTLTTYDDSGYDGGEKFDPKPEYRTQPNSSLILLLTDNTNGHGPGMCGAADYTDSRFWLIDHNKHPQQLFSFSYGSCSSAITYLFNRNGKEISGSFYIADPSDDRDISFENSYWKDKSTYVLVFHDQEESLSRNYYLHFNAANNKVPVTLKVGKLRRLEKPVSQ